jgi:tetratricopeptide (TPR) repeat protein
MAALEAAQAEGGDIRGKQSAALLVVSGDRSLPAWSGRIFDLRIEDHLEPVKEMRRLLTVARAYNYMNAGDEYMTRGEVERAVEAYGTAEALAPDNHEMVFWHAATLAGIGRVAEALPLFKRAFAMWPGWRTLVPRLPASGLLPDDPELIERIVAVR